MVSRGAKSPQSSSWGKITAGDELDGLELGRGEGGDEQAEGRAEERVEQGHEQQQPRGADHVEAEDPEGDAGGEQGLDDGHGAEGERVAA